MVKTSPPVAETPWRTLETAEKAIAEAATPWDKAKAAGEVLVAVRAILVNQEIRIAELEARAAPRDQGGAA